MLARTRAFHHPHLFHRRFSPLAPILSTPCIAPPTGESLAQVLCLAGVRPIADSIGRVNKLELIPLEELGRPRIDVVVSCSGVFRDLFINQMNLLDRGVSYPITETRAGQSAL